VGGARGAAGGGGGSGAVGGAGFVAFRAADHGIFFADDLDVAMLGVGGRPGGFGAPHGICFGDTPGGFFGGPGLAGLGADHGIFLAGAPWSAGWSGCAAGAGLEAPHGTWAGSRSGLGGGDFSDWDIPGNRQAPKSISAAMNPKKVLRRIGANTPDGLAAGDAAMAERSRMILP